MNAVLLKMFGQERYITDADGKAEFVVLPIEIYKNIVDFIEDYGLGAAIREAEGDKRYNLEESLNYLDDEN